MLNNFLPLRREIRDHWIYQDSEYLHVWIDILLNTRFSEDPKKILDKGKIFEITRGQFLFSRRTYATRLNISESKIRKVIELLIADGMIKLVSKGGKNKASIYEVINYERYNNSPSETLDTKGVQEIPTQSKPSKDPAKATKEESKEGKNEKNNTTSFFQNEDVHPFFEIYKTVFKDMLGQDHYPVTEKQATRIMNAMNQLKERGVDHEDFEDAAYEHLSNLPDSNNGNILAFIPAINRHFPF